VVREAASGKTREKQRAFYSTPIVRDLDNNRARARAFARKTRQKIPDSRNSFCAL
jgi:hypothetical protein